MKSIYLKKLKTVLNSQASKRMFTVCVCLGVVGCVSLFAQATTEMGTQALGEVTAKIKAYVPFVQNLIYAIAGVVAVVGSILYFTTYPAITPTAGAMPGLKSFVAAVFGGIGSIPGAVIGAFLIGICETIIKGLPSSWNVSVFSDAFTLALLIIILTCKPTGLFGEKATDKV